MHTIMMYLATSGNTVNSAYLITAILSAVVVVVGGIGALVRVIWRTANVLRDNTIATQHLTARFDDMAASVDGRFDKLSERVQAIEQREFGRHDGSYTSTGEYLHGRRPAAHGEEQQGAH